MSNPRMLTMDSVTKLEPEDAGKVLIAASHGGVYAGYVAALGRARGVILNDAGGGLDGAGYGALDWADRFGMPAAVVDCMSARIGDGEDMRRHGVLSRVNATALKGGVVAGRSVAAAAARMATLPMWEGDVPALPESRFVIRDEPGLPRVIGCDSASLIKEEDAGQIVVCASHGGLLAGAPDYILKAAVYGCVLNDAGMGKDDAGVARVHAAERMNIAAVAVSADSARIGDARSTWETGVLSTVNRLAADAGAAPGMTARAFVDALAEAAAA